MKRWRLSAAAAADVVQEAFIRLMRVPQQQDIWDVPRHLRRLSRPQPSTIAARREEGDARRLIGRLWQRIAQFVALDDVGVDERTAKPGATQVT